MRAAITSARPNRSCRPVNPPSSVDGRGHLPGDAAGAAGDGRELIGRLLPGARAAVAQDHDHACSRVSDAAAAGPYIRALSPPWRLQRLVQSSCESPEDRREAPMNSRHVALLLAVAASGASAEGLSAQFQIPTLRVSAGPAVPSRHTDETWARGPSVIASLEIYREKAGWVYGSARLEGSWVQLAGRWDPYWGEQNADLTVHSGFVNAVVGLRGWILEPYVLGGMGMNRTSKHGAAGHQVDIVPAFQVGAGAELRVLKWVNPYVETRSMLMVGVAAGFEGVGIGVRPTLHWPLQIGLRIR
jgi:hypothetical protein